MADYDAQIRLLVSGLNQVNDLESRLNRVQNTLEELNELGANAVFGRNTDFGTYRRAIEAVNATVSALRTQVGSQLQVNETIRDQTLLYSRLNREQALFRRRSASFTEESRGVRETNQQVIELTTQLRTAQRAFSTFFSNADLEGARTINAEISSILEQLREVNRIATGTKSTGANTAQLQAQADGWNVQIAALRRRASALEENEEILGRLAVAERNLLQLRNADMTFREDANVRLGKQELSNALKLIGIEEQIASNRRRDSVEYERQLNRQSSLISAMRGQVLKAVSQFGSATLDAVTFGKGNAVARGTRNAAVRGGIGLAALGVGKLGAGIGAATAATADFLTSGPQSFVGGPAVAAIQKFAQVLNSAMGGIPDVVVQAVQALGNIPDALGLAAVAALALAPATNTAAKSVYNLGKAAGSSAIGKPLSDFLREVNPIAKAAYGSIEALQQGIDQLRGQKFDLQEIGAAAAAVSQQINESYKRLPLALPAAGETSFKGVVDYDDAIGATVGGGVRKALSDTELLVGSTGKLANRSQEAAEATLLFAERMSDGSEQAGETANKLERGAQEAKRIAEFLKQASELRVAPAETSAQRFIRETIEKGRRENENETSAQIARERSRILLGGQYPLSQVPAGGELFPGGRTETAQPQFRDRLNEQARIRQLVNEIVEGMSKQQGFAATIGQLERRAVNDKGKSLSIQQQENNELERSVQIIRERNRELRQRPVAAMTPQERVAQGILDPASLRAQRRRRVEIGRLDPLERFFAGFQPRRRAQRSARAASEGLIGGAFPLLFGQGLGASLGGGLGGALGGFAGGGLGFGLSLIGTALGTAFDTTIQAATELGAALNDLSTVFDKVKERALFSSREVEKFATKLQEAGLVASASIIAQQEIIRKIGAAGVEDLRQLESSSDRFSRAWAEFNLQLQSALAGPMAGLLEWVTGIVEASNRRGRQEAETRDIFQGLSLEDQKKFNQEVQQEVFRSRNLAPGAAVDQIADARRRVAARFAARSRPVTPPGSTPELIKSETVAKVQKEIDALNSQIEAIDIGKKLVEQFRDAVRQQEDLNQQAFEVRKGYEEAIGDIRLNIQRTVQQQELDNIRVQNELYEKQGEIRLQQLENANRSLISEQGANDYGRRLFEILGEAASIEVSTQQELENRRREFELELQSKAIETEIFKGDIARQVARLNEDTQKRIADINKGIRRANEQYDEQRFKLEKAISTLRIKQIEAEIKFNEQTVNEQLKIAREQTSVNPETIKYFENLLRIYKAQENALVQSKQILDTVSAPPKLKEVGGVSSQGVSTAAYDAVRDRAIAASRALLEADGALTQLARDGKWQEVKDQLLDLADQGYEAASLEFDKLVESIAANGDEYALAGIKIAEANKKTTDSLKLLESGGTNSTIDAYRKAGLSNEQIRGLLQIGEASGKLAAIQLEGVRTAKFYTDSLSGVQGQIRSLTEEIEEATTFGTNYEKALESLAKRGLSYTSEQAQVLLKSVNELDVLEEKAEIVRGITAASEGLADSLRGLVQNFYELGSASEAVKAFNEEISKKAVGFVLDIAFKPVEDSIRKSLVDFAKSIGIDLSTPAEKTLTELETVRTSVQSIEAQITKFIAALPQPQATATTASPGGSASSATSPVSRQFETAANPYSSYIQGSAFQAYLAGERTKIGSRLNVLDTEDNVIQEGENIKREYRAIAARQATNPAAQKAILDALDQAILEAAKKRIDQIRTFTGQGGPIREAFPMKEDASGVIQPQTQPYGTTPSAISPLPQATASEMAEAATLYGQAVTRIKDASVSVSSDILKTSASAVQGAATWQKSLGQVVTGLGLAATSVIGIVGGVQQIQQGGAGNVISGIGSILTTVGGIGLSLAGGLGGLFGGGGGGFPVTGLDFLGGASPLPGSFAAKGATFANGMARFAKGGVVNSPTLFQFANGGSLNNGLMGEAGPEAIMPLKRGSDGRLGVAQVSDGSAQRRHEAMGASPAQQRQAVDFSIKFETTMINGVEYVSKDQLDEAMAKTRKASISEGAKRGMSMTLDKLQQSPSTRSRVGIR